MFLRLIFAQNLRNSMNVGRVKHAMAVAFSLLSLLFWMPALAQQHDAGGDETKHEEQQHLEGVAEEGEKKFDANEVIFGHVMDAHEFHFFSWKGSDGHEHHATIPLPVLLYSPQKGFSSFMSSRFEHGHATVNGYKLVGNKIVPTEAGVQVYDFSLTRNVVQMFIAVVFLLWIMMSIARRYKIGQGITTAPKGLQNAIEPVITFVRDEVAKPNIGHKYGRYMPLLLTIFFFILINNIFGLIPGSANVTGNIAFTAVLGVIAFFVINFSGNKNYWSHILWPPVPHGIKLIMIPVEILGIITKPFALIIRLFANMLAGHIIIICLISLIFIFGSMSKGIGLGFSPISLAFAVFIYVIEILVAFIQAFIFTNLTAVFIGQAVEEGHHGEDDHQQAPTEPVIV
jgi:F-type H+-transporting ATPase subunit a